MSLGLFEDFFMSAPVYCPTFYSCHVSFPKSSVFRSWRQLLHALPDAFAMNVYFSAILRPHAAGLFAALTLKLSLRQLALAALGAAKTL